MSLLFRAFDPIDTALHPAVPDLFARYLLAQSQKDIEVNWRLNVGISNRSPTAGLSADLPSKFAPPQHSSIAERSLNLKAVLRSARQGQN